MNNHGKIAELDDMLQDAGFGPHEQILPQVWTYKHPRTGVQLTIGHDSGLISINVPIPDIPTAFWRALFTSATPNRVILFAAHTPEV